MTAPSSQLTYRIWIIEDNTPYREAVMFALESEDSITCEGAFRSAEAALQNLQSGAAAPHVVLLDLDLPGMHGLEALLLLKQRAPDTHVLILTEFDERPKVFQAISEGASGYLLKSSPIADISRGICEVMTGGAPLNARIAKMMLSTFTVLKPRVEEGDLTSREREVLVLLARGLSKKQVAGELAVSYHTVDMHTRGIYKKLQVHNLSGAVSKAIQSGLI
jgi:DNA-binding NarL/FixJ family response regulator